MQVSYTVFKSVVFTENFTLPTFYIEPSYGAYVLFSGFGQTNFECTLPTESVDDISDWKTWRDSAVQIFTTGACDGMLLALNAWRISRP